MIKNILLLLCITFISFSVTGLLLYTNSAPPICANSGSCVTDLSIKLDSNTKGVFQGETVYSPSIASLINQEASSVLGATTAVGDKHIYVDIAAQKLYAYQGSTLVMSTFISSGKWTDTPIGNFNIWEKLLATRMTGGEGADAYDLPNVPYVMYFYRDFGLHGAYWHDNFGHEMSHGCVNMRIIDAKALYDWADGPSGNQLGTPVSVCNQITSDHRCIQTDPIQ